MDCEIIDHYFNIFLVEIQPEKENLKGVFWAPKLSCPNQYNGLPNILNTPLQIENLITPFVHIDLKTTVRQLLEIKKSIWNRRQTKLNQIKFVPLTKLNLGFVFTQVTSTLKASDAVTNKGIQEFKEGAQEFIAKMLPKLFDRSSWSET